MLIYFSWLPQWVAIQQSKLLDANNPWNIVLSTASLLVRPSATVAGCVFYNTNIQEGGPVEERWRIGAAETQSRNGKGLNGENEKLWTVIPEASTRKHPDNNRNRLMRYVNETITRKSWWDFDGRHGRETRELYPTSTVQITARFTSVGPVAVVDLLELWSEWEVIIAWVIAIVNVMKLNHMHSVTLQWSEQKAPFIHCIVFFW